MDNISLIIPCAGKSNRFSGKPKWLKTCPNGNLMIQECIKGLNLNNVKNIYFTFLKEHIDKHCNNCNIQDLFLFTKKKIHIYIIDKYTKSQTETIYKTIKYFDIKGAFFIKDCDNYFEHKITNKNCVCTLNINNNTNVNELHNKSFIEINNVDNIINICEKQIISNIICVGGYGFEDTNLFIEQFEEINTSNNILENELYVSHIIYKFLLNNIIFKNEEINNYIDWGTQNQWNNYFSTFKTLFIDIDGTLFKNSSQYFSPKWGTTKPIEENINYIKSLYKTGRVQIILTTSRKEEYKNITIDQLKTYDIPYDNIIFNLFHCKRYLINDYASSNPYPSSISINLKRDSNNLNDYFT
jgi:hypothetical protein